MNEIVAKKIRAALLREGVLDCTPEDFQYLWRGERYGCHLHITAEKDGLTIAFYDECGTDYQNINEKGARALTAWLIRRGYGSSETWP